VAAEYKVGAATWTDACLGRRSSRRNKDGLCCLLAIFVEQRGWFKVKGSSPVAQEKAWRSTSKYHSGCTNWYGLQLHSDEKTVAVVIHLTGGNGEVDCGALKAENRKRILQSQRRIPTERGSGSAVWTTELEVWISLLVGSWGRVRRRSESVNRLS
jgi:hypothetical protein